MLFGATFFRLTQRDLLAASPLFGKLHRRTAALLLELRGSRAALLLTYGVFDTQGTLNELVVFWRAFSQIHTGALRREQCLVILLLIRRSLIRARLLWLASLKKANWVDEVVVIGLLAGAIRRVRQPAWSNDTEMDMRAAAVWPNQGNGAARPHLAAFS